MDAIFFFEATLYLTHDDVTWETRLPSIFDVSELDRLPDDLKKSIIDAMILKITPPDTVLEMLSDKNDKVLWEAAAIAPLPVKIRIFVKENKVSDISII